MADSFKIRHKKYISLVIYYSKSREDLLTFLVELENVFSSHFEKYEYIIVNNLPGDDLKRHIEAYFPGGLSGELSIIHLSWKHNIEDAMRAGITLSIGDLVYEFDRPFIDYDPQFLLQAYEDCITGYDMVTVASESHHNRGSRAFYKVLEIFSRDLHLMTDSFRIVTRRMINMSSRTKEVFSYRKANYQFTGLRAKIIHYHPVANRKITSKASLISRLSLAGNILIYYSSIGTMISLILSLFFLVVSVLVGIYVIISFILYKNIQEGWSSIMLFLSLSFTGLFGILAILSKYVEVLLRETKSIAPYTYQSIEKIEFHTPRPIVHPSEESP